jgi:hypothetical protein
MVDLPVWYRAFQPVIEMDDLPTPLRSPVELASRKVTCEAPSCFLPFDYWNGERMTLSSFVFVHWDYN